MEYGSLGEAAAFLIEKHVLTAAGSYSKVVVARHSGDNVGINAGAVDNDACLDLSAVSSLYSVLAVIFLDSANCEIKKELCSVVHSVSYCCDAKLVGANDRSRFSEKRAGKILIKVGLKSVKLVLLKYTKSLYSVSKTATVDRLDLLSLVLESNYERLISLVLNAKTCRNLLHKLGASYVHLCLK